MRKRSVQVGQVYQSVSPGNHRSWRVRETLMLLGLPHARVVSTEDEGDTKTLSCLVLADPNHYRLVTAPMPPADVAAA